MHDYVVGGAGSAGCVLAARLTEDPDVSVLLLEAGRNDRKLEIKIPAAFSKLFDSPVDWGYRTAPQPGLGGREVFFPRGKVVGGTSSINAMMVLRGRPADQEAWALPGWSWADVQPAYARSAGGPFPLGVQREPHPLTLAFVEAAVAAGIPRSDLELIFAPVPFEEEGLQRPSRHGFTIATVALQPRSVGEVRLRSSDPADPPVIDPRYLSDSEGHDADVLLRGVRLARRLAATPPLSRYVAEEFLPGPLAQDDEALLAHLRERSQTLCHPVGTCRMGAGADAVLDPELRVRGIEGLRVVDASAIPRLPRGHTNWPTVMLAERGAELIRAAR